MRKYILLLLLVNLFPALSVSQKSHIKEYETAIKTYPFSDPDPFPIIAHGSNSLWNYNVIYPYFRYDGFSHQGKVQKWKMVRLENDYITAYILPDMGGKLWGAIDKKTGKEFIYMNDVIKFRDIAQRGPWTSGGIEFNTGIIGHFPGGSSPVDYKYFIDDKKVAHCIIGGIDLTSNITWRVDISLAPEDAYFQTKVSWFNDSPLYQAYYYWSNAAVKAADDLQFYFPGDRWIDHDGSSHLWTVDKEGRDQGWYKNNRDNETSSFHVLRSIDNSYVSFYHNENFGSGHWSPPWGTVGRKIWLWAQSDRGEIWKELLSDTHGQYIEVQAGRMFNQNFGKSANTPFKQTLFQPYNSDSWAERWFPINNMHGVTRVSDKGVLYLDFNNHETTLEFCPITKINGEFTIRVNDTIISQERLQLKPAETFSKKYKGIHKNSEIVITLDQDKIYSTKVNLKLNRPIKSDGDALKDGFNKATELYGQREYTKALNVLLSYIKSNPQNLNALANIAEIYYYRGEQGKAMEYCIRALKINTYHPWTNFIYANINKDNGDLADAVDGYRFAMRSPEFRSPSFELLSELYLKEHEYEEAVHLAKKSLDYNKNNINALKVLAIANRLQNNTKEAERILKELLDLDPLNHFAMFERFLITKKSEDKNTFLNAFHNEMAKEDFLNMGIFYAELGLKDEAVKILTLAPDYTVIKYWLAYLNQDTELAEKAIASDPLMVFPFRIKSLKIFNWVNTVKPSWKTDYYKSLILWNKGRKREALSGLNKWKDIPDFPPFYYSRSSLNEKGSDAALKDMKKALETDPDQWRLYKYLADIYNERKEYQKAVDIAKKGRDKYPESYVLDIAYAYALSLTENYKESLKVLSKINVLPFEGENRAQKIYFRNYMMLALTEYQKKHYKNVIKLIDKSEQYPRIFGSGSPTYPDYRGQEYLKAKAYEKMGQKDKAEKIYQDIIDFYNPNKKDFPEEDYSKLGNIFALMEKGRIEEANKLLDEWASSNTGSSGTWEKNDPSDIGKWVKAVVNKDPEKKAELEKVLTKENLSSDNLVIYRIIKLYVELKTQ